MLALAQSIAAGVVLARLSRGRSRRPALVAVECVEPVSVVIPARDEAARIGPCLNGLAAEAKASVEVIVVIDEADDPTAAVARAAGARVIVAPPLAEGWVGKPWALKQGVDAATHDVVVCLDADVRPKRGLLGALTRELAGADFITCAPRFLCEAPAERFLQASMLASLVYRFGPGDVEDPGRMVANGQCTVTRRSWFLAQGGYEQSIGHMTDDIALARTMVEAGHRVGFRDAADLLDVKMYDSVGEIWREWGRSLGAVDTMGRRELAGDLAVVWLVMALPVLRLVTGRPTRIDRALLALRWAMTAAFGRAFDRRDLGFWLSPLADPATATRLTMSAVRPSLTWRGRTYASAGPRGTAAPSGTSARP